MQCVDGAFCQPLPDEMVDRGMPVGPKYVAIEQLEVQAVSIRPVRKHIKAMERRDEMEPEGRIRSLEAVQVGTHRAPGRGGRGTEQALEASFPGRITTCETGVTPPGIPPENTPTALSCHAR